MSIAAGDFNGDGTQDVVINSAFDGVAFILLGEPSGFTAAPGPSFSTASFGLVTVGDWNHDGILDLAFTGTPGPNTAGAAFIYLGIGGGRFAAQSPATFAAFQPMNGIASGDIDGDGNPDLVLCNRFSDQYFVLLGDGVGGFGATTSLATSGVRLPSTVQIGDFNGDGRADLIFGNNTNVSGTATILTGGPDVITFKLVNTNGGNPVLLGSPVTITATAVLPMGFLTQPTGSLTFLDGSSPLGSAPLSGGTAVFTTTSIPAGNRMITAMYGGDIRTLPATGNAIPLTVEASAAT